MSPPSNDEYSQDAYWSLPEGCRAELIDGVLYDGTPPSAEHQALVVEISGELRNHLRAQGGRCRVFVAPFAVNLTADERTWVEPDVLVVCDPSKISKRGCEGAPDLVVEVVSPSSVGMDYFTKAVCYCDAGVREYWIVDPLQQRTATYYFGQDGPLLSSARFDEPLTSVVFPGFSTVLAELLL